MSWAEKIYTPQGLTTENVIGAASVLDVGCGQRKLPGALGMDVLADSQADIVHDLGVFPWPGPEGTFDLILMNHVLEHVPDATRALGEAYRLLKPGGSLVVQVPYFRSVDAYNDPTHVRFFTHSSLDYVCRGTKLSAFKYTAFTFDKRGCWYDWPGRSVSVVGRVRRVLQKNPWLYDQYFSLLFPARNVTWELVKPA